MKKTEVTRQVRFPFSATICGIWCRHDLWCVTQIKYLFLVIQVITNIHHYIIGKLQWHSNSCEMTDEMWKLIEINCETTVVVKTTSCLPRTHPIFTRLSSKTCSGMVPHKVGMMYWNLDAKLSNKTYDFCIFVAIDLKIGTHIDWTYRGGGGLYPANTQRFLNIAGKFRWAYLGQTLQQPCSNVCQNIFWVAM